MSYRIKDILKALNDLSGGRCIMCQDDWSNGSNKFIMTKSSDIPGKAVTEMPGLV